MPLSTARRERREDVVGLGLVVGQDRDPEHVEDLAHEVHLRPQWRRRLLALGLVLGIALLAERRGAGVERDGDVVGSALAQHPHEHVGEAVDGVGGLSVRCGERLGQREERTVRERVSVEHEELGHRGRP